MSVRILLGDCREKLRELPDASVHCCVTSPPYFGLRDYGTAAWSGGDDSCPHEPTPEWIARKSTANAALGGGTANMGAAAKGRFYNADGSCPCGATRIDRQMGLEPTPDEYVAGMVEVFREVRRVLRDDGTLWLNIGDSYVSNGRYDAAYEAKAQRGGIHSNDATKYAGYDPRPAARAAGLKPKDLIGIPWMLAFALRADGWYLRQDIIWSKPNPMPESVRDRCTKAHEYLFLLSKSPRYFFDAEAIAEPAAWERWGDQTELKQHTGTAGHLGGKTLAELPIKDTKNKRSVWTVTTQPYSEAHFATYPPALIEPCILAGCPKGGTVMDPFGGAGTTGLVADRLGRNAVLIELNPEYAEIARNRLAGDGGMFTDVKVAA